MNSDLSVTHFDPDEVDRFDWLAKQLGVTSLGLSLMVLQPGQRGRIHRHQRQEEVYLVLEGELSLQIEEETTILKINDVARVAPAVRRQLSNAGSHRCVLLAMGGYGVHNGRDAEAFNDWSESRGGSPRDVPVPEDIPHT